MRPKADPQRPWPGVSTTVDQVVAQLRVILDAARGRKLTSGEYRQCESLLDFLSQGVLAAQASAAQPIDRVGGFPPKE
jgi:hypothetical protein